MTHASWYHSSIVAAEVEADSYGPRSSQGDQRSAERLPRPIHERRTALKKILLMNGPNLNMLGVRDRAIYGSDTLADIEEMVRSYGAKRGAQVDCFQSNHEGALIDRLHAAHGNYDGIVYNPGAHTHYSYALHDAVETIDVPVVEIHISDISQREEFRRTSVIAPACIAQVKGLGKEGYLRALDILLEEEAK